MAKFADYNALDRWKGHILDAIDGKSNSTHRHALVNGKRIVISDTVPTANDENVITLIVDTAHVPVANMELQEAFSIVDKTQQVLTAPANRQFTAWYECVFQTLIDDELVPAEYQFERAGYSSRTVMREYSSDNVFSIMAVAGSEFYVKVKADGVEREFTVTTPVFDQSSLAPQVSTTGIYVDNQPIVVGDSFTIEYDQLLNAYFRHYVGTGVSLESVLSSELFVEEYDYLAGYKDENGNYEHIPDWEPERALSAISKPALKVCDLHKSDEGFLYGSLSSAYDMLSENTYAFLTNKLITYSGETVYSSIYYYIGYNLVYDHFANHWEEQLYGYLVTSKPENNGKLHVAKTYNSGTSYYYDDFSIKFTFDAAFGYDITISLVDTSDTPLNQSTRFPLKPSSSSEFTLGSGSKSVTKYLYHRVTTTGTYYIVANISGGGFEQSVSLKVEVVDTDL